MPTKRKPLKDWTEVVDGKIDVPDQLMPIFNKIATQLRFHTISGKGEVETIAHILCNCQMFFYDNPDLLGVGITDPPLTDEEVQQAIDAFSKVQSSPFGPPSSPGVYGVFVYDPRNQNERLIYIGSSGNVRQRVMNANHIYIRAYRRFEKLYVITKTLDTDDYVRVEKALIKHYKPFFNVAHRNG